MAVRTGAGTGVIVSLVVFVLTTVFLLVLTLVFYAGKTDAVQQAEKAQGDLEIYIKRAERSNDRYKGFESARGNRSVAAYLNNRYEDLAAYVGGERMSSLDEIKADLAGFGVAEGESVRQTLADLQRSWRDQQTEIEGLNARLGDRDAELAERDLQIQTMRENHAEEIEQVSREIVTYRDAAEQYRADIQREIELLRQAKDTLEDEYAQRVADLEDELDRVNQEVVVLRARVDEYEAIFNEIRIKSTSPELLVDARVIDVDPANDQVFIDRGRKDRIVLGMTFEVYDDVASIRVDPRTGVLPRGKASLQVVKVAEATSTCKVTRNVPGRPVIRNDVLANAIYDPEYRFKFLVHGKFDWDGDGRPSEAEAEHLRNLVVDWGGEIVLGDNLPGDLDFLVLGQTPPLPAPLPPDPTEVQIEIWIRQREAHQKYMDLFSQASEAQIPVLNDNRFFILIGRTER